MNKKIISLIVTISVLSSTQIKANELADVPLNDYETWFQATENKNWTFELKNKDQKKDLWIKLVDETTGQHITNPDFKVKKAEGSQEKNQGYLRITDLDPTHEYLLYLLDTNDPFADVRKAVAITQILPNNKRKVILLKFEKGQVLPQEGQKLKAKFTGELFSQSGIKATGNVTKKELKKTIFQK